MSTNYTKLKTNLRLCIQRLKMAEKKKTELTQKSRGEIAEYLGSNKVERARIRVENIIREDYLVEAMELVEMYCDILITRFGMIQQMKTLDDSLAEAISSLIWVAPRIQNDVSEIKIVSDLLTQKYGKPYAQAARDNSLGTVSPQLISKLSISTPPKSLIEKYLIEIARTLNVPYEPDEEILQKENETKTAAPAIDVITTTPLIDLNNEPVMPTPIAPSHQSDFEIVRPIGFDLSISNQPSTSHNVDSNAKNKSSSKLDELKDELNKMGTKTDQIPPPNYDAVISGSASAPPPLPMNLPNVSNTSGDQDDEDIDFEDLARRFEALKKA